MKRWIFLCVALLLILTACSSQETFAVRELEAIRETGTLRIGVTDCPPFSQQGEGWFGFDIALAEAVCQELGLSPAFVAVDWESRVEALTTGQVDCLWSGLTARSDLAGEMDFSQTYLASRPALVVPAEAADTLELAGMTVAVESGSAGEAAVQAHLPEVERLPMATQQEALAALASGQVQGAVVDILAAQAATAVYTGLQIQGQLDLGTEELAVGLRKGSDLTGAVNEVLAKLQAEGTLEALAAEYAVEGSLVVG